MKRLLKKEKEFVKFLIKKNIAIRFRKNLKDYKFGIIRKGVNLRTSRLLRSFKPHNYLRSFDWGRTDEGTLFWAFLDRKWRRTLDEKTSH